MRSLSLGLVVAASLSTAGSPRAAPAAPIPTPAVPVGEHVRTTVLAPGLAVLSYGPRGNVAAFFGPDRTVLVDAMYEAEADYLGAALASLKAGPVRVVIDTHWHHDHAEGNAHFARAGALVIGHENVRVRMSAEQFMAGLNRRVPASPDTALPQLTYRDEFVLRLNGDTLRAMHAPSAHTDGDTIVYWEKANVLQMGDIFNRVSLPFIGINEGGSIDGMIAGAARGLALADDWTRIVPGHGPVATRADLAAYHAMLVDIRDQVAAGIASGRSLADIVASKPAAPYGMADAFIPPDLFVELVYHSLKKEELPPAATRD